jgi:hypothetical protein
MMGYMELFLGVSLLIVRRDVSISTIPTTPTIKASAGYMRGLRRAVRHTT